MFLIDSHCHLDRLDYENTHASVDDVLLKAKARGVDFILSISTTLSGFVKMREFVGERPDVAFSCGVHPLYVNEEDNYPALEQLASQDKVIALGETGLDYYYQQETRQQQQTSFAYHIQLANTLHKPLIVHTRDARQDTLSLLREGNAQNCGGVLHCFTEDNAMAKALLDLGFYISLSGILTFRNANELREVARYVPLERLLIETDSPYLAPMPYRGKENQPAYVREVAECLAGLKGVTLNEIAEITCENFCNLFKVKVSPTYGHNG